MLWDWNAMAANENALFHESQVIFEKQKVFAGISTNRISSKSSHACDRHGRFTTDGLSFYLPYISRKKKE